MPRSNHGVKRIEFRYNQRDKEIIVDREGTFPSYAPGDIVERRGKSWKAVRVLLKEAASGPQTLYVQVVSLTDRY
jgi:hypothetical protein